MPIVRIRFAIRHVSAMWSASVFTPARRQNSGPATRVLLFKTLLAAYTATVL